MNRRRRAESLYLVTAFGIWDQATVSAMLASARAWIHGHHIEENYGCSSVPRTVPDRAACPAQPGFFRTGHCFAPLLPSLRPHGCLIKSTFKVRHGISPTSRRTPRKNGLPKRIIVGPGWSGLTFRVRQRPQACALFTKPCQHLLHSRFARKCSVFCQRLAFQHELRPFGAAGCRGAAIEIG